MVERFEDFTLYITQAYKYILKIKAHEMETFGLKASHLMCLYFFGKEEEGLTAVELCSLCMEDKAGISKTLSELKKQELITVKNDDDAKIYKAKYVLTEKGAAVSDKLNDCIIAAVENAGMGLSDEERQSFYYALKLITSNLGTYCSELEEKHEPD